MTLDPVSGVSSSFLAMLWSAIWASELSCGSLPGYLRAPVAWCPGSPGLAVSIALRARSLALASCGPRAPGCGGRRLKSGGIVSGARDSTANSSGVVCSSPIAFFRSEQPEIDNAQAKQRTGDVRRARGAPNRYLQDMAQIPPHRLFNVLCVH